MGPFPSSGKRFSMGKPKNGPRPPSPSPGWHFFPRLGRGRPPAAGESHYRPRAPAPHTGQPTAGTLQYQSRHNQHPYSTGMRRKRAGTRTTPESPEFRATPESLKFRTTPESTKTKPPPDSNKPNSTNSNPTPATSTPFSSATFSLSNSPGYIPYYQDSLQLHAKV